LQPISTCPNTTPLGPLDDRDERAGAGQHRARGQRQHAKPVGCDTIAEVDQMADRGVNQGR
jgi:hypothetical protein